MTIFKLIVHGIELHGAFEERENKHKNTKFTFENLELSFFFPQNCVSNAILWEMKNNSKLRDVYNYKLLVIVFTNKDFYE